MQLGVFDVGVNRTRGLITQDLVGIHVAASAMDYAKMASRTALRLACVASIAAICGALVTPPPPDAPSITEGATCSPPFGFQPLGCTFGEILNTSEEILPKEEFGINVCRLTRVHLVNDTAYTYQRRCADIYDSKRRYYFNQCFLDCLPVRTRDRCTNSTHTENRTSVRCCSGTAPDPANNVFDAEKEALFAVYHPLMRMPSGCPVAQGPTLLQCLMQQRLTDFLQLIMKANLTDLINSTSPNVTLFAAVNGQVPSNLSAAQAREFVLSQLVPRIVNGSQLVCGVRLEAMTGNFLHIGSVEHTHRRRAIQSSHYRLPVNAAFREVLLLRTQRFVNGREVVIADACNPSLALRLHVLSAPAPISNQSLFVLLSTFSNLSDFLRIVNTLQLGPYLSLPSPHTILAPSNEAFSLVLPTMLRECLQLRERRALSDLLLYHISQSVEYVSSLAHRSFLYTKLLRFIPVEMGSDNRPLLGRERAAIIVPDITAENGVMHIIDKVLIPPDFSYGSCEHLTPPPPTPPEPVTTPQPSPSVPDLVTTPQASPSAPEPVTTPQASPSVPEPVITLQPSPSVPGNTSNTETTVLNVAMETSSAVPQTTTPPTPPEGGAGGGV